MGNGSLHSLPQSSSYCPIFSDSIATEDRKVLFVGMAASTSAGAGKAEQSASAVWRLSVTPENIERLSDSIKDVQEFLNVAPRLLKRQWELEERIDNRQSLKPDVSKDRVFVSEGKAENISSSNRQSTMEVEYENFYAHQREDFIDFLQELRLKKNASDKEGSHFSDSWIPAIIFENAYHSALESKECFVEGMSSILKAAPKIGADIYQTRSSNYEFQRRDPISALIDPEAGEMTTLNQSVLNHLKLIMKETSGVCDVEALTQMSTNKLLDCENKGYFRDYGPDLRSKVKFKKYVEDCCRFAWRLVCQTPPYVLGTESYEKEHHPRYNSNRHEISRHFKHAELNSRSNVSFVLWPGLFAESPPRVIKKTEVIVQNN